MKIWNAILGFAFLASFCLLAIFAIHRINKYCFTLSDPHGKNSGQLQRFTIIASLNKESSSMFGVPSLIIPRRGFLCTRLNYLPASHRQARQGSRVCRNDWAWTIHGDGPRIIHQCDPWIGGSEDASRTIVFVEMTWTEVGQVTHKGIC